MARETKPPKPTELPDKLSGVVLPKDSAFRELQRSHALGDVGNQSGPEWYARFAEHARAKLVKFQQITPADRYRGFARLGFRPHGLYLPADDAAKAALWQRVWKEIGAIPEERIDERLAAYAALQDETAGWERDGVPGAWGGQQAVARSNARFRVVGCARRWGKTALAAHEALSCALQRPRSKVWLCAPIMRLVDRAFKIVVAYCEDYHLPTASVQNTAAIKRIVFENGAIIDGVSMENVLSMAGDEVDVAIIDEAAQMYPDAWSRGVLPPLLDRNGQALLISSWEGMEGIFFQLFEEGKRREDGVWECFSGRSADNFFVAPQGEDTPALVEAKRSTDPLDYHEQYGGVAAHQRLIIYPELNLRVHVERTPFDPGHPVILAGDPSGGAVEYAVLAIQDYPAIRRIHIIDEVYLPTGYTEQVIREVEHRPWRDNVSDVVLDSANPAEIERWGRAGFPAYGVYEKLRPEDSYPMIRRALRDPVLYYAVHQELLAHIMHGKGYALEEFEGLPAIEQRVLLVDLEEYLNDPHLPQAVIDRLKGCAQLRIDPGCVNTILEHQNLHRIRPRQSSSAPKEAARKWKDHTCDALRYFMIQFHRWDGDESGARVRMLMDDEDTPIALHPLRAGERETDPHDVPLKYTPDNGWLVWARETYTAHGRSRMIDLLEDR